MNEISTGHIAANIIKIDKPQPHLFGNLEKKNQTWIIKLLNLTSNF